MEFIIGFVIGIIPSYLLVESIHRFVTSKRIQKQHNDHWMEGYMKGADDARRYVDITSCKEKQQDV